MKPTDTLREHHRVINLMLDILKNICRTLESGETVRPEDLDSILAVIRSLVGPHQTRGENLVLSACEGHGISRESGAMPPMMTERNILLEHVRNLRDAVAAYRKGDRGATDKIILTGRSYITLLRHQMEIEEQDIHPRLDIYQTTEQHCETASKLEQPEIDIRNEALQTLWQLKERYLAHSWQSQ